MRVLWVCLWIGFGVFVAYAQIPPVQESIPLESGVTLNGRIDSRTPRQLYTFEGSRGEVVRLAITVTTGDLDLVLTLFDSEGTIIFTRDETPNSANIETTLSLNSDSVFYAVVGRFGYAVGTTTGEYALTFERVGVVSQQGITLRYGISVIDTITNTQPQVYYTFRAEAGDIVNIEMKRSSGNLDPYLQVVDGERFVLASNDDALEGSTRNARIDNLLIEKTGAYIVVATRYGQSAGDSVGSFVLTLNPEQNSGIGNSSRAPALITYNQTQEGNLTNTNFERFYRFSAQENDIVTITLEQIGGRFDAYLVLADSTLQSLIEDDDSGGGRNARINKFRIPATGDYMLIAMRYGGATGEGEGRFRLQLRSEGNAFDAVDPTIPRLLYGTTVPDQITDQDPSSLYVFWGSQGDIVTITMSRVDGDLDPVLQFFDNQQRRLIRDDDSGGNKNASITRYTLPYTGIYYISAERYSGDNGNPNTQGNFMVVLARVGTEP